MTKANLHTLILIVGFTILILLNYCGKKNDGGIGNRDTLEIHHYEKFDSTIYLVKESQHHYTKELIRDTIFVPPYMSRSDSEAFIMDYLSKRVIRDSIRDSNLVVYIVDTLFKNDLLARNFSYKLLRPVSITNNTIVSEIKRNKFYFGIFTGFNFAPALFQSGISIDFLDKTENNIISADYDPFHTGIRIKYTKKISFRSSHPP